MPFVIAILAVIVVFRVVVEMNQTSSKENAMFVNDMRKTNAQLEQRTLEEHLKSGASFDEAYRMTENDLVKQGFVPCIPMDQYEPGSATLKNFRKASSFDSNEVKRRREALIFFWNDGHNSAYHGEWDDHLYDDFPHTLRDYRRNLRVRDLYYKLVPVGKRITIPIWGTCEVIGYQFNSRKTFATYILRVVGTDTILKHISVEDKQIRRA
jgi:hypothetical protein